MSVYQATLYTDNFKYFLNTTTDEWISNDVGNLF